MENITFAEVLESTEKLSFEEQESLIDILHRRMVEHRRRELAKDIQDAQEEFQEGRCRQVTSSELMQEILS